MSAHALVETLLRYGIRVNVDGDQIRVNSHSGTLTDELRQQLKACKGELLIHMRGTSTARDWRDLEAELTDAQRRFASGEIDAGAVEQVALRAMQLARRLPENADDASNLLLSDWFKEDPLRRVRSRALSEIVLFAADEAEVPVANTLVVYRESELSQVVGMSKAQLRATHDAKKILDGIVETNSSELLVEAHELVEGGLVWSPDTCDLCSNNAWWTKANGEPICGVCHPDPKTNGVDSRSAHNPGGLPE